MKRKLKSISSEENTDDSLTWKCDTPALLQEIANCAIDKNSGVLKFPLNMFQRILGEVAQRAIELDDKKLNKLMIRLALYDGSHTKEMMDYLKS